MNETSPNHVPNADPDWNHLRQTVLMLQLAVGQVEAAMRDSSASVAVLTDSFTAMASSLDEIDGALGALPDVPGNEQVKAGIHDNTRQVAAKVRQSIIAFQFYDRLAQRLDHTSHGLNLLCELVGDGRRVHSHDDWLALQATIRSRYTMPEEHDMFDAVMQGVPVVEALATYVNRRKSEAGGDGGDIELF